MKTKLGIRDQSNEHMRTETLAGEDKWFHFTCTEIFNSL